MVRTTGWVLIAQIVLLLLSCAYLGRLVQPAGRIYYALNWLALIAIPFLTYSMSRMLARRGKTPVAIAVASASCALFPGLRWADAWARWDLQAAWHTLARFVQSGSLWGYLLLLCGACFAGCWFGHRSISQQCS